MSTVKIGVLALQGAFAEHVAMFNSIPGVTATEVRTPDELQGLDGIVLPGGESTAISLIGEKNGIFEAIKKWVNGGHPVWGTCAGCIMLAKDVQGQKQGGQGLVGGMDISVHRNFFGRQIASFETEISLNLPSNQSTSPSPSHFPGVFIRAPAILGVKEGVKILGEINTPTPASSSSQNNPKETKIIVAAQQGPLLATVFHPELTSDKRVHEYFVEMVRENQRG
eukprot:Phypoly_transcript_17463.p1 GENE.Phypoly_transcript_17463~~Phypoly_transcript_17463.p1  ORF type:complete len:224 (+),score=42.40 Phypoly_transcript_17463:103-774(+)